MKRRMRFVAALLFAACAGGCSFLFGLEPNDYAGGAADAAPAPSPEAAASADDAQPPVDRDASARDLHLYVLGGSVPLGGSLQNTVPTDKVYFAPITKNGDVGTFRETTRLPVPIRSHAAVAFDNHVYVLGGETNQEPQTDAVYVAPIEADGQLGGWVLSGSRLPSARKLHAVVTRGPRVFVMGGLGAGGRLGDVVAAELSGGKTGPFVEVARLDEPTFALAAAARGDRLYALGGLTDDTATRSTTLAFDVLADGGVSAARSEAPLLDGGACYHGAGVIGDALYTIGAVKNGVTLVTPEVGVATLDGQGKVPSFRAATSLPVSLWSHAVTVALGRVYVTGGLGPNAKPRYDHILVGVPGPGATLTWSESPTRLPQPMAAHGAVIQ